MSDQAIKSEDKENPQKPTENSEDTNVKDEKIELPAIKMSIPETSSQATLVKEENTEARAQTKRKNMETSDDEEDFAGFDNSK
jgi:hypothetical protein